MLISEVKKILKKEIKNSTEEEYKKGLKTILNVIGRYERRELRVGLLDGICDSKDRYLNSSSKFSQKRINAYNFVLKLANN